VKKYPEAQQMANGHKIDKYSNDSVTAIDSSVTKQTATELPQKCPLDALHHFRLTTTAFRETPRTPFLSGQRGTFPEIRYKIRYKTACRYIFITMPKKRSHKMHTGTHDIHDTTKYKLKHIRMQKNQILDVQDD